MFDYSQLEPSGANESVMQQKVPHIPLPFWSVLTSDRKPSIRLRKRSARNLKRNIPSEDTRSFLTVAFTMTPRPASTLSSILRASGYGHRRWYSHFTCYYHSTNQSNSRKERLTKTSRLTPNFSTHHSASKSSLPLPSHLLSLLHQPYLLLLLPLLPALPCPLRISF
jgi:hypothetical protein